MIHFLLFKCFLALKLALLNNIAMLSKNFIEQSGKGAAKNLLLSNQLYVQWRSLAMNGTSEPNISLNERTKDLK